MESVMMKCGCRAMATCSARGGVTIDPPIPSCVIHDCFEVADGLPDLTQRTAQCSYRPDGHAPRPSSFDLPFFRFKGEGSPAATEKCKCGYGWIAHQPHWKVSIKVSRRWFDHDPYVETIDREFHAPEELAAQKAEIEADFFRKQTRDEKMKVYSAEVTEIKPLKNPLKCKEFVPHGTHAHDEYYCGCHGWD